MLEIGDIVGSKYRIDALLGEGGFGRVFLATTLSTGRPVAVKVIKFSENADPTDARRFRRELQAIARLQSPHTLTLLDSSRADDDLQYSVTEYVEGEDLDELLARRGTLTEIEVVHLLTQMLRSLAEAHAHGILHRDVKPANIRIFEYEGDPLRAKLLDFGIARFMGSGEAKLTRTGLTMGTPRFMSPEQIHGDELGPPTDIYSLGLVAYDALVGGSREVIGLSKIRLPTTLPIAPELRQLIDGMLELLPKNRISATEGLRALREIGSLRQSVTRVIDAAPMGELPETVLEPVNRPTRADHPEARVATPASNHRGLRMTGLALVSMVGALAVLAWNLYEQPPPVVDVQKRPLPAIVEVPLPSEQPDVGDQVDLSLLPEGCRHSHPGSGALRLDDGVDGVLAYIPTSYDPHRPSAVLFVLQDRLQQPEVMLDHRELREIADEEGIVLIAFEALTLDLGETAPSLDIITEQVRWVESQLCIDSTRRHVLGIGEGGHPAAVLACRGGMRSIVISGYRRGADKHGCDGDRPPLLFIAPTGDPSTPTDGGRGCLRLRPAMSLRGQLEALEKERGCRDSSQESSDAMCRSHICAHELTTCIVDGGRFWPGTAPAAASLCRNPPPTTFDYFGNLRSFIAAHNSASGGDSAGEDGPADGGHDSNDHGQ